MHVYYGKATLNLHWNGGTGSWLVDCIVKHIRYLVTKC